MRSELEKENCEKKAKEEEEEEEEKNYYHDPLSSSFEIDLPLVLNSIKIYKQHQQFREETNNKANLTQSSPVALLLNRSRKQPKG